MPAPFTTPVALSVPFEPNRNPGFGGVPSNISSNNVQDAIEEAVIDAIENDRYVLLCSYNGNANAGRYLEFFNGISSFDAPIVLTTNTRIISIVARTTASAATCTIQFVNVSTPTPTVLYSFNFSSQKQVLITGTPTSPLFSIPANSQLALRVSSGSINTPHIYFFLNSSI